MGRKHHDPEREIRAFNFVVPIPAAGSFIVCFHLFIRISVSLFSDCVWTPDSIQEKCFSLKGMPEACTDLSVVLGSRATSCSMTKEVATMSENLYRPSVS